MFSHNFWCRNFVERHSFRRVSSKSPETLQKLHVPTKFPHQKISLNFGILRSEMSYFMVHFDFQPIQNVIVTVWQLLELDEHVKGIFLELKMLNVVLIYGQVKQMILL